jgi:hypothetical protein
MTISAMVGNVHIWPLVNTGVGVSLIHTATVEQLQLQGVKCIVHKSQMTPVVGVGGNELVMLGLVQLPITISTITRPIELHVILVCPAAVLLRTGTLHNFGLSISFKQ